jgi:hypothetical protein
VELFSGDQPESDTDPTKGTLTRADGRYFLCLPSPPDPSGSSGPDGLPFEVRARKAAYRSASQSFRFVYSVWDYGDVEINLDLVPD